MIKNWENTSEDVKKCYGSEYIRSYRNVIKNLLETAQPEHKIYKVIDDMVDAVAGTDTKVNICLTS